MRAATVLIRIARGSGRSIKTSEEAIKEINEFLDLIVITEEIEELFQRKMLEKILTEIHTFSSLGMTFDEYWDYERKMINKSYSKEQYSLSFNRPSIRHQVDNRKPRHLVKKIIR